MTIAIKAPTFPESITDGTIVTWHKQAGESVERDDLLVDIETDKVVLEVVAPDDGVLQSIEKQAGDTVASNEVIGQFKQGAVDVAESRSPVAETVESSNTVVAGDALLQSPAVRRLIEENHLDPSNIIGTGKQGRIIKEDILNYLNEKKASKKAEPKVVDIKPQKQEIEKSSNLAVSSSVLTELPSSTEDRVEKRVPMTRLRARVAERLVQAQQTAAMLTTFNEVNMQPIMTLRKNYKDEFEQVHNVRLGFMSFFVKAATEALKRFPVVNASIDGPDIVYHGYYDVGVAVSSDRGLVVPIIRDTDQKNLAELEQSVADYGVKAKAGKLSIEDMTGGTFTISNGGVFGSLMSTPILNPPQTAILGMHKIQERPMVANGEIVIQPMMYLALSYDHRLIDGKEAVQFLVSIKGLIEDPTRLLLDL